MNILECKSVCFSYGKKKVLCGVSLQAEAGELVGLLGANGSGKTTLLKSICAILSASGEISIKGESIKGKSEREMARLCSYIPQRSGIDISISALDVVLMGFNAEMGVFSQYSEAQREAALAALSEVGAGALAERDYQSLSEGEKQLCIIARAFVSPSSLYLLDEPESSLDFVNRNRAMALISNKLKESGRAAVVSLHEPTVALRFCDRLVLIADGRAAAVIDRKKDSLEEMEKKLSLIYGDISLYDIDGRLVMMTGDKL